jgi:hypothetical protein
MLALHIGSPVAQERQLKTYFGLFTGAKTSEAERK